MAHSVPTDAANTSHDREQRQLVDDFHKLYYNNWAQTWEDTYYQGHKILKCPLDLWVYHEIIWERQPYLIIETGTAHGGSALWFRDQLAMLGPDRLVVSIDVAGSGIFPDRPHGKGLAYMTMSSTDPDTLEAVRVIRDMDQYAGKPTLVVLDSAHEQEHVYTELQMYSQLVGVGDYLIVEDSNIHGHPIEPGHPPGPMEALEQWLPENPDWVVDPRGEKFFMTFNPRGTLRRVS